MGRVLGLLTVYVLVVFSGFASRAAWESLRDPKPAEAQSAQDGDLYDCDDFTTSAEA